MELTKEDQERLSGNDVIEFLEDDEIIYKSTGIDYNKVLQITGNILKKKNFRKFLGLTFDECIAIGWKQSIVAGIAVFRTDIASSNTFVEFGTLSIFENNVISIAMLSEKNAQSVHIEITKEYCSCKVYDTTNFISNFNDPTKIKHFKSIPEFPELVQLQKELA